MQRERVPSIRLKVSGRIDRTWKERLDEIWAPDAIAVAAAGREVVLPGDELSRGINCQRCASVRYNGRRRGMAANHTLSGPLKSVAGPKITLSDAYVPAASGCLTPSK